MTSSSIYASRIDRRRLLLWSVGPLLLILSPLGLRWSWMICAGVATCALLLMGTIWFFRWPCRYALTEDALEVHYGRKRWQWRYPQIRVIDPSNSREKAPALSHRRLKIETDSGQVLISPRSRARFLQDLRSRIHPVKASKSPSQD